jgi:signal transduction histidine kinase
MVGATPDLQVGRIAVRVPHRSLLAGLWILAGVAEVFALRPVLIDTDAPINWLSVLFALVGGSFAAFGLLAWRKRPDSRSGALMTATGFGFFASPLLGQLDAPVAFTAALFLVDIWIFPFVALLLTLLTAGRLTRRIDRWLVASYALPLGVLQLAWVLCWDAGTEGTNLLLAFPDEDVAHVIDRAQRSTLALACVATSAVIAVRWWQASAPRRRALLASLAGMTTLLCFTLVLVNDLITGDRSQTLLWIAVVSFVTVPAALAAGLLRSRLARGGVADLFLGLRTAGTGDLQAALRRALGDPGATIAYWLPDYASHADASGEPVELPAPGGEQAVTPIERNGRRIAALVHDATLDEDPELVRAVAAAAAIAIENERLHAEAQAGLAELKTSRERIVAAGDAERRRLERNLHDGAQQRLVGIALQLRLLQRRLRDDPSAEQLVATASDELAESLAELRELARGIHPAVLEHGLAPALQGLAARAPVPTVVTCEPKRRLPEQVELAAYFVASEALTNVAKYADASQATVRVWRAGDVARIEIADDGVGGADDTRGSGLRGLADRVEALDGRLRVRSPAGKGTTVTAELPCES